MVKTTVFFFWFEYILSVVCGIFSLLLFVLVLIMGKQFIRAYKAKRQESIMAVGALAFSIFFLYVSVNSYLGCYKGYTYVSENILYEERGKMVEFTDVRRYDDGDYSYNDPKFYLIDRDEYIVLSVSSKEVEVGGIYQLLYLPGTHLGRILFRYDSGSTIPPYTSPLKQENFKSLYRLCNVFYREFVLFLAVPAAALFWTEFLFSYFQLFRTKPEKNSGTRSFITSITILIMLVCIGGLVFTNHIRDYRFMKQNDPLSVTGEVVRMDDLARPISGRTRIVVSVNGTDEVIELSLADADEKVTVGETYSFLYLPYTHIAEPIGQAP